MFIFKEINSNDMGVYVREENFLGKAPMRYDSIEIEGKHGADLVELGYQNFEGTLNDVVIMNDNFDEVLHWLSGTGELIYMGKKTRVHFLDAYQIAKHKKTFSVPFIREPFWYDLEDDYSEAWGANLIPNGWDSFEPYGSGEDFNERNQPNSSNQYYSEGSGETSYGEDYMLVSASTNYYVKYTSGYEKVGLEEEWHVMVELESSGEGVLGIGFGRASNIVDNSLVTGYNLIEATGEGLGNGNLMLVLRTPNIDLKITRVVLTNNNDRYLLVRKIPLENGLTRIQTWGGNNRVKLVWTNNKDVKDKITVSTSFEPSNDMLNVHFNRIGHIEEGVRVSKLLVYTGVQSDDPAQRMQYLIKTRTTTGNLDFIASTPTIVEGDTPPTWEADANPRIINEGTAPSKPLIKLTKGTSSTCEFEVNGVYFKYHFNNDDHVIIDCEEMEATYNGLPRNRHLTIGFEFPTLKVGDNVVKNISGDAKIEFKRKDRWL